MALLTSCLCCNLLLGAIASGVYVTMVYLLAFIISVWWIIEEESMSDLGLPAPAYLLCVCYIMISLTSAWMLFGLYKKKTSVLLGWVFLMTLFCFPEMGMVAFMTFIHRKITSPYGLADLIFYVFRAAFNLLSVLCVQSQYSIWRDAHTTSHTLKRLQHIHLNSMGKEYGGEEEEERAVGGGGGGGGEVQIAYHNPGFLASQEGPQALLRPTMTRSLSRASSLRGWSKEMSTVGMSRVVPSVQVRTGLPGWDPYMNRDSQAQSHSEFNAAAFTPASMGFMPLARSEVALYPSCPPSPTPSLTVYHHTPPQHLYPLHLPHLPTPLPSSLPLGDPLAYPVGTQSLDRRRYVRRWQGGRGVGGGGGGVVMNGSRSSLGGEGDDLRKYRDVAL